jgi:hypothetical protein
MAIHNVSIEVARIISKDLDTEEGRYVKDIMKGYPTLNPIIRCVHVELVNKISKYESGFNKDENPQMIFERQQGYQGYR